MGTKVEHKGEGAGIRDLLQGLNFHRQIVKVLPKHLPPDRFVRVALTAIQRNPDLLKCDKESFFNCLLSLTELALEPDGRRAHLIPFWSEKRKTYECQLIIDYKGYVDLITRPGKGNDVSTIYPGIVREHDDFIFNRGIVERHVIDLHKTEAERGPVIGAYVIIRMKDGAMKCEIMNVEEIAKIKARSKASKSGPWITDENEMRKKTVLRRAIKTMPINDQTAKALEVDYDRFDAIDNNGNPKALPPETPTTFDAQAEPVNGKTNGKTKDNPATTNEPPDDLVLAGEGNPTKEKELDVFDSLEKELADFYEGDDAAMQDKLMALTSFEEMKKDKNGKYTKEPTGKIIDGMKFVSEMRMKGKTAWAGIALQKLRDEMAGER